MKSLGLELQVDIVILFILSLKLIYKAFCTFNNTFLLTTIYIHLDMRYQQLRLAYILWRNLAPLCSVHIFKPYLMPKDISSKESLCVWRLPCLEVD